MRLLSLVIGLIFLSGKLFAGNGSSWGLKANSQMMALSQESGVPVEQLLVYDEANVVSIYNYGVPYKYSIDWNTQKVSFEDGATSISEVLEEARAIRSIKDQD